VNSSSNGTLPSFNKTAAFNETAMINGTAPAAPANFTGGNETEAMPSSEVDSTDDDKEPGECKCGLVYAPGNLTLTGTPAYFKLASIWICQYECPVTIAGVPNNQPITSICKYK
jgi:hypothetical protein